MKSILCSTK